MRAGMYPVGDSEKDFDEAFFDVVISEFDSVGDEISVVGSDTELGWDGASLQSMLVIGWLRSLERRGGELWACVYWDARSYLAVIPSATLSLTPVFEIAEKRLFEVRASREDVVG